MKKSSFIILFVMLVSGLYAQEFKLIGGVNTSKYNAGNQILSLHSTDSYYSWDYRSGFLVGMGIEYSLVKKMAIEIDVLYFQKGSLIKMPDFPNYEKKYFLDMISLPILIKLKPLHYSPIYILGGGELSFIFSHRYKIIYEDDITEYHITWKTKKIETGLVLGGGFEIKLVNFLVFIEGRYYLGLGDIEKEPRDWEFVKTNSAALIIGIKI